MILSMDALFGLPRKCSSGLSCRDALHGRIYFVDQASVDEFVQSTAIQKIPQVINYNNFAKLVVLSYCMYITLI